MCWRVQRLHTDEYQLEDNNYRLRTFYFYWIINNTLGDYEEVRQ